MRALIGSIFAMFAVLWVVSAGMFTSGALAAPSNRYIAELRKCGFITPATDNERLAACNYMIAAGPRGGQADESTDNLRYVGSIYNRAQVYSRIAPPKPPRMTEMKLRFMPAHMM